MQFTLLFTLCCSQRLVLDFISITESAFLYCAIYKQAVAQHTIYCQYHHVFDISNFKILFRDQLIEFFLLIMSATVMYSLVYWILRWGL